MIIKEIIKNAVAEGIISGASYALISKDTIECNYVGNLGSVAPFDNIPLNGNYRYDLASCSKVVGTTTRIL